MKKEYLFACVVLLLVVSIFFYPIFKGYIPFPGDLLVGNYEPYKSYSHLGYAPGGVPHKAQGIDVLRELYPWKHFTIEELKKGNIPFWNPHNFAGNPHFANLQSGPFYIANMLFFSLPFNFAWALYIFLEYFLAGFFTYVFLRKIALGKLASILGGMCFAFSGFMVSWGQWGVFGHALLWLPLVLFLILRHLENKKLINVLLIIASLIFSILAGYIQVAMYVYIFVAAFLLYTFLLEKNKRSVLSPYFQLVFALIAPPLLTLSQLLPTIEFLQHSLRTPYTFNELSERLIPIVNLITIVIPDFFGNPATRNYWLSGTYIERSSYIGITSFVFALSALYSKHLYRGFFAIAAGAIYLSALDILPVKLFHTIGIPFLSTGVPSRILSLYCFAIAVLAAIGFHTWQHDKQKKYVITFCIVVAILFFAWITVLFVSNPHFSVTKRNLILPSMMLLAGGVLIWLRNKLPTSIVLTLFVVLIGFDLFYYFHKITPFSPKEFMYPKTPLVEKLKEIQHIDRYWGYGSGNIEANFQLYEKNYSAEGYDALYIKRFGELAAASKDGKIPQEVSRTVATIAPGYGESDLRNNIYRKRALDFFGIKYILNKNEQLGLEYKPDYQTFPQNSYSLVWQEAPWQIYENKEAFPRIFLASSYIVETEKEKIIEKMYDPQFDLRTTIILEEDVAKNTKLSKDPNAHVSIQKYAPDEIVLTTNTNTNMLLVLSDNFYPGWEVSIDGKRDKIYRANYTFRAVAVTKGEHKVVFWYKPAPFDLGLKITVGSFFAFVLFFVVAKVKKLHV